MNDDEIVKLIADGVKFGIEKFMKEEQTSKFVPGTVVSFTTSTDTPNGYALVQLDSDPQGEVRSLAIITPAPVTAGSRVLCYYDPPFGAYIWTTIGGTQGIAPAGKMTFNSTGSGQSAFIPAPGNTVPFNCEELSVGGMVASGLSAVARLVAPDNGTYAVALNYAFSSLGADGSIFINVYDTDGNVVRNVMHQNSGDGEFHTFATMTIPLLAGQGVGAEVSTADGGTFYGSLDAVYVTTYTNTNFCSGGGST